MSEALEFVNLGFLLICDGWLLDALVSGEVNGFTRFEFEFINWDLGSN